MSHNPPAPPPPPEEERVTEDFRRMRLHDEALSPPPPQNEVVGPAAKKARGEGPTQAIDDLEKRLERTLMKFKPLVSREVFESDYRRVVGKEPPPMRRPPRLIATTEEAHQADHKEKMDRRPKPGLKFINRQLQNRWLGLE